MGLKQFIIQKAIDKRKKNSPFDEVAAENFMLSKDADITQNNSFYFSAHTIDGVSLLFRKAYRGGGRTELWVAFKDKAGNAWVNEKQEYDNEFDGLTIKCVEPAKLWEFKFDGFLTKLKIDDRKNGNLTKQKDKFSFEGCFSATAPIFEFSRHFDSKPVARALAREKLKKGFSKNLSDNHQVHYEQSGKLDVKLSINDKNTEYKNMPAIRDHSYGKRDWGFMDRHVWIIALIEDGSDLNFNCVRYPIVRELQTGYLINGDMRVCTDYYTSMDEYEKTDDVPLKFTSTVVLANGKKLTVMAEKEIEFKFAFDNNVYQFHEGIGKFDINGKKARGIIEFGYNKDRQRWDR